MKKWRDIPEYEDLWQKFLEDYEYFKTLQYDEHNEFDTPERKHHEKWNPILCEFMENYQREHPEEFDADGRFKV